MKPTYPAHFEGEIANYWFEDGVLIADSKNVKRTVDLIRANAALVKQITGNKPVPLLIYLKNSPVPDQETQRFSTEQLPQIYSAMAIVADSAVVKIIMNLLFKFRKPPIPIKSFKDDQGAREWLMQFVSK